VRDPSDAEYPQGALALPGMGLGTAFRLAVKGDGEAFEELVEQLGPRVFRYLVIRLRSESDARDALQETLVAAWQGLHRVKNEENVLPWLFGIATHKAVDTAKARLPTDDSWLYVAGSDSFDMTSGAEIQMALMSLRADERDILLLRYVVGLSEKETSRALGIRVGTVKSRCSRARTILRGLLASTT
jgi:RNA polymerase sigma-70 factor (ECF subfamily)